MAPSSPAVPARQRRVSINGWRSSRGEGLSGSLNFVRISVGCEAMSCPTNLFVVASGSARAALVTRVGRPGGLHRDRGSTDDGASDAALASRSIRFGRGTGVDRGGGNLGRRGAAGSTASRVPSHRRRVEFVAPSLRRSSLAPRRWVSISRTRYRSGSPPSTSASGPSTPTRWSGTWRG